jgi:hypothetical protein
VSRSLKRRQMFGGAPPLRRYLTDVVTSLLWRRLVDGVLIVP